MPSGLVSLREIAYKQIDCYHSVLLGIGGWYTSSSKILEKKNQVITKLFALHTKKKLIIITKYYITINWKKNCKTTCNTTCYINHHVASISGYFFHILFYLRSTSLDASICMTKRATSHLHHPSLHSCKKFWQ